MHARRRAAREKSNSRRISGTVCNVVGLLHPHFRIHVACILSTNEDTGARMQWSLQRDSIAYPQYPQYFSGERGRFLSASPLPLGNSPRA